MSPVQPGGISATVSRVTCGTLFSRIHLAYGLSQSSQIRGTLAFCQQPAYDVIENRNVKFIESPSGWCI